MPSRDIAVVDVATAASGEVADAAREDPVVDEAVLDEAAIDDARDTAMEDGVPAPGDAEASIDAILGARVDAWRVELWFLCWLPGIDGTVGVAGQTSEAHESFLDIVDSSDSLFGYCGRVETGKGPWSIFLDGLYDRATDEDAPAPPGLDRVDITFEETLLDFGAMYRVIGSHESREASFDIYGGARYTALEVEFESASLPTVSDDHDWIDPIFGARFEAPLDRVLGGPFRFAINGDIGGFGISSDLTWSATALVAYDFDAWGTPASVFVGYRAVGWDYSDGGGTTAFTWDIVQHGLLLGFALQF